MAKATLVIMAAGIGSRFGGGIKQLEPVGPNGEIIMDYSIYDAMEAGFDKVVFVIRKDLEKDFKEVIGNRIEKVVEVAYAYQEISDIPEEFKGKYADRAKPWGTGQAILCCKDVVSEPFLVINADDYYGKEAYVEAYNHLIQEQERNDKLQVSMVGFVLGNTLSENGGVTRGICKVDENHMLTDIVETSNIEKTEKGAAVRTEDGMVEVDVHSPVSMNMWGFSEGFLQEIKAGFAAFLKEGLEHNPLKCEYFLPTVVSNLLKENRATVSVLTSKDKWYGVTYKNDKQVVVNAIQTMKDDGIYPEKVWCGETEALLNFQFNAMVMKAVRYGSGHINDTFLVTLKREDGTEGRVILQRMNKNIFKNTEELMENILGVTSFLRKKIIENGGDPERETLNVIPTKDGNSYFVDSEGEYWRCYNFIEGATSYDQVESEEDFYQSAVSFGNFQRLLADYPAETLHETIKGFHDTKARFETFKKAVKEDVCGRAHSVQNEIQFVLAHEDLANAFGDMLENKELPLRVTHNDTKLNNIMIDNETHKGICVIDLDTVMPGLAMNDFGDSIRFGASTGAEDETDLDKIQCDMNLFDIYAKGFIEGCAGKLTTKEIELLPLGAKVMTFECGMRFLTDYLQGDTYFKIHRENHNLDRCRTQFKLVSDMEAKWDTMNAIIQKYKKTH